MKVIHKLTLAVLLMVLLLPVVFLFGNPLSYALIYLRGNAYLEDTYPELDVKVSDISYDFKRGGYVTEAASPTSRDTHFQLYTDWFGNISADQYHYVTSGINTAERIGRDYRALADSILDSGEFPWPQSIAYGELTFRGGNEVSSAELDYGMDFASLELDKAYNIQALGAAHGRLVLYLHDEQISVERAADLLLELKEYLDEKGLPFHGIHFTLCQPLNDQGQNTGDQLQLVDFLYEDIYEEGLTERIAEHLAGLAQ